MIHYLSYLARSQEPGAGRDEDVEVRHVRQGAAKTFEDLVVWQKAHAFVLATYHFTATFPTHETYGVVGQMRRAAVSIPANIAEGFKKR